MQASLKRVIAEEETLWPDVAALHGLRLPTRTDDNVNVHQWYVPKYLLFVFGEISMFVYYCGHRTFIRGSRAQRFGLFWNFHNEAFPVYQSEGSFPSSDSTEAEAPDTDVKITRTSISFENTFVI